MGIIYIDDWMKTTRKSENASSLVMFLERGVGRHLSENTRKVLLLRVPPCRWLESTASEQVIQIDTTILLFIHGKPWRSEKIIEEDY